MVVTFVFCQFFPIVGDVHELICLLEGTTTEGICESNIHIENCINFGHFMLMVNSSVNFIFYMTNIVMFRQEFLKVFCRCFHSCYQTPSRVDADKRGSSKFSDNDRIEIEINPETTR